MSLDPAYLKVYTQTERSPERKLWTSVMLIYLLDIQNLYNEWREAINGSRPVLAAKINSMRNHINSEYTDYLCALADIEAQSFKKKANAILDGTEKVNVQSIHY